MARARIACSNRGDRPISHERVCELDLLRVLPNGSDQAGARLIICCVPEGFACKFPLVQTRFFETAAKVAAIEVIPALFEHNLLVEVDEIGCTVDKARPV